MADPKAAPLADELKEFALSLAATVFPKNFFCTLCNQLAVDSYKLLCCNKAICASCQTTLNFPTTCPSCDHSPLEADSCTPNKALRNTMRVWLEKRKKKEEAKAAAPVATPPVDATPAAPEVQPVAEQAEQPVESIEETQIADLMSTEQAAGAAENAGDPAERTVSASAHPHEDSTSAQADIERRDSNVSQNIAKSVDSGAANGEASENPDGGAMDNPQMMNGMQSQMGFGFPNQGNFNNGMGWNGMNGMPNMMGNGGWNGMNSMDFNNMNGMANGMYGNFGGNMGMGMGMNDMSAMNMMNFGGGFGNGWSGMGDGYGNFNGQHNQMGGYNQSGAYPEMMNQIPKNSFPNQNQNRFHANQGGAYPQKKNRNGSFGGFDPGSQNARSRPGSRGGPTQHRDGQSPGDLAVVGTEAKAEGEQTAAEGKDVVDNAQDSADAAAEASSGNAVDNADNIADPTGKETAQGHGLNQIQTVDSGDADVDGYNQSMMGNGMQPNMPFPQGMMNQFTNQHMNNAFNPNMNMNMGYDQHNNFGPRGGFNQGAYGAARVLTGQPAAPVGVGVVGAPTGPRAMREGRPNNGFMNRGNIARNAPLAKSVTSAQDAPPASPQRRVRSRSPQRDESLRVKERSPSRSRSRTKSRERDIENNDRRERSRSADHESQHNIRNRSRTPQEEDDHERRKEHRRHRSSRHDGRDEAYDERYRGDRDSRGDRTRSASVESKYRSSRREKEKHRSSRSQRDRSKDRRRYRSQSPGTESKYEEDDGYNRGERESDSSARRKHRSGDKDKDRHRERSRDRDRDRDRDRKDRKERDRDYDYERSREKDKDRRRRRDREAEEDERDYDDDKYRSSRRSRKDRDRERERDYRDDREDRENKERPLDIEEAEDGIGKLAHKRVTSPPFNPPTGPSANGFSIKGRSKSAAMPPPAQPPTGPRALQPPKGPAADRNKDRSETRDHKRKTSVSSLPSPSTPVIQDHYAAERERNARERDSRDKTDKTNRDVLSKSLHSRVHSSSSQRPSLSSKRSREDINEAYEHSERSEPPRGPKAEITAPAGPASHRHKRRKSGAAGDDNIADRFTAGLRKNAKARRGGVRTEGDVEREMERVERERGRR